MSLRTKRKITNSSARGMAQDLLQELKSTPRGKRNGQHPARNRVALHPKMDAKWTPLQQKMRLMLNFSLKIASEVHPDRLLHLLAEETRQMLEADRCTVFLYDPKTDELWTKLAQGKGVRTIRLPKDKGLAGHVFTTRKALNVTDAYKDPRFSREVDPQTGYRTQTALAMPMLDSRGEAVLGVFEVLNKMGKQPFGQTDEDLLTILAKHAAVAVENAQLYDNLKKAQEETVFRLALLAEYRAPKETALHLRRMSIYSRLIAEAMGLSHEEVENIHLVAPLHDIGKVATPDAILHKTKKLRESEIGIVEYRLHWWMEKLKFSKAAEHRIKEVEQFLKDIQQANHPSGIEMAKELVVRIHAIASQKFIDRDDQQKPLLTPEEVKKLTIKRGNLTEEERDAVQRHTHHGAKLLAKADSHLMQLAERIAISHHEKYDGTGYPEGLRGDAIPLEGRIVALADVFDALRSRRMYKKGWSLEEILDFVRRESGKHFDPQVVKAFFKALPKIKQVMDQFSKDPDPLSEPVAATQK